jgi:hypothetical protein
VTDIVPGGDFFAAPQTGSQPPAYGPTPAYGPPPAYSAPAAVGQPAVNHFGMVAPAGPVPPTEAWSGGSPPARAAFDGNGYGAVPELVTVAYTLLAVFASGGLFVGLLLASVFADVQAAGGGGNSPGTELVYGGSGLIGVLLVFALRKGAKGGQVGATALAGLWTLYWSYTAIKLWGSAASSGFVTGSLRATGTVGSLAMLAFLVASGAVGALLWTPSAKRHFG